MEIETQILRFFLMIFAAFSGLGSTHSGVSWRKGYVQICDKFESGRSANGTKLTQDLAWI